MAAFNAFVAEEQLLCSICLEIFTKPVSTPCGHNFCMVCLNKYWDSSQKCTCPFCKKEFSTRPQLCVNAFISNLATQIKESVNVKPSTKKPPAAQGHVPCDVCTDPTLTAHKSCLNCGISFCDAHLNHHKTVAKLKQHTLIDAVKNLEDYICQRHQRPLELLCKNDQLYVCLFCTEGEHKSHKTVPLAEESAKKKTELQETQAEVQKMVQEVQTKIKEIKRSAVLKKGNIDKEKNDSAELFRCLIDSIQTMQTGLFLILVDKQRDIDRQAEVHNKALNKEIAELKRRDTELEKLLHCEDHLHLLQTCLKLSTPTYTNNLDTVKINTNRIVDDVMRELHRLQQSVSSITEKLSVSRNLGYQREEIQRLLKTKKKKGDTWYLVDSKWFDTWKDYVGFHTLFNYQIIYPGPVDNSGLLKDSLLIKERLINEQDYNLLPEEAWNKLVCWYGLTDHQKPIVREVIEVGLFVKQCEVEVYLTELRLCEFSNMNHVISRHFSKADTVGCIEREMRKIFHIPYLKKTRLWTKYMDNAFRFLDCPGKNIYAAYLFPGHVVLIEQMNGDGTWPRESQKRKTLW